MQKRRKEPTEDDKRWTRTNRIDVLVVNRFAFGEIEVDCRQVPSCSPSLIQYLSRFTAFRYEYITIRTHGRTRA